jgi:hypothetical protein
MIMDTLRKNNSCIDVDKKENRYKRRRRLFSLVICISTILLLNQLSFSTKKTEANSSGLVERVVELQVTGTCNSNNICEVGLGEDVFSCTQDCVTGSSSGGNSGSGGGSGGGSSSGPPSSISISTSLASSTSIRATSSRVITQPEETDSKKRSDINDDGIVDLLDFNLLMVHWGKTQGLSRINSTLLFFTSQGTRGEKICYNKHIADIDCNGLVDIIDFNFIMVHWLKNV